MKQTIHFSKNLLKCKAILLLLILPIRAVKAQQMPTTDPLEPTSITTALGQMKCFISSEGVYNPHDQQTYHLLLQVAPTNRSTRFKVYTTSSSEKQLATNVACFFLLLYREVSQHLHFDHPAEQTLSVWLSPSRFTNADVGGEQFRNQIYIYDIYAARSPFEWCRELAHEYGHYILPGVTGFTSPEPWANGVLGERLFTLWIAEDISAKTLDWQNVPFLTPKDLDEDIQHQLVPLIMRIAGASQFPMNLLRRNDAEGMNAYTALCLYIEAIYGSDMLLRSMALTLPSSRAPLIIPTDFLSGFYTAVQTSQQIRITIPSFLSISSLLCYLPSGKWSCQGLSIENIVPLTMKSKTLKIPHATWALISIPPLSAPRKSSTLILTPRGR